MPCDETAADRRDASTGQGTPRVAGSPRARGERRGAASPSEPPGGTPLDWGLLAP